MIGIDGANREKKQEKLDIRNGWSGEEEKKNQTRLQKNQMGS